MTETDDAGVPPQPAGHGAVGCDDTEAKRASKQFAAHHMRVAEAVPADVQADDGEDHGLDENNPLARGDVQNVVLVLQDAHQDARRDAQHEDDGHEKTPCPYGGKAREEHTDHHEEHEDFRLEGGARAEEQRTTGGGIKEEISPHTGSGK